MSICAFYVLVAARRVADLAQAEGAGAAVFIPRATLGHMGAVVADAILQAGLNYESVVRPRVAAILRNYPKMDRVSALARLVEQEEVSVFLGWVHPTKIDRFGRLVEFLRLSSVETSADLRVQLEQPRFCQSLRVINGVGPKTIDYLACLVGLDSVAVDRHLRSYAARADVHSRDYFFLRDVFCCAADLLKMSRRTFDAWVWGRESTTRKFERRTTPIDRLPSSAHAGGRLPPSQAVISSVRSTICPDHFVDPLSGVLYGS